MALFFDESALSSSLIINTRLEAPAFEKDSIMSPGLALAYTLGLPVRASESLMVDMSSEVQGSLRILATAYATWDLPTPAGPARSMP